MTQPTVVAEAALGAATVDASVRIEWSAQGRIAQILIAGRPSPRPYDGEGNHTTAWAVFGDVVRRHLVGLTKAGACNELSALRLALHTLAQRNRFAIGARRTRFYDAGTRCQTLIASAQGAHEGARLDLARAIGAYLSLRQYAPLASVWLGDGVAIGGGEATALRTLRTYETAKANASAAQLRGAIWRLLDPHALRYAIGGGDHADMPGAADDGSAALATELVVRHLTTISLAYPCAYETAAINAGAIDEHLATVSALAVWPDDWTAVPDAQDDPDAAPADWSTGSATGIVVALEPNDTGTRVGGVSIHGRGRTLLAGQGHHMTAHIVFEAQVQRALVRPTLMASRNRLTELVNSLNDLGTLPAAPDDGGEPAIPAIEDVRGTFAAAWSSLTAARQSLADAVGNQAVFESLAETASAYLCVRNALPLAAVNHGAPANNSGEGPARDLLEGVEQGGQPTANAIHQAMWKLLNLEGAAEAYEDMSLAGRRDFAPGAVADGYARLTQILSAHRVSMLTAFPTSYARAQFGTVSSVRAAVIAMGIPLEVVEPLAAAAGFAHPGPPRTALDPVLRGKKKPQEGKNEGAYEESSKRKTYDGPSLAETRPKRHQAKTPVYAEREGEGEDDGSGEGERG